MHSVLMGLTKELENLAVFQRAVQDRTLARMLERQRQTHSAAYNAGVALLAGHEALVPEPELEPSVDERGRTRGVEPPAAVQLGPDLDRGAMNDRLIAYSHCLAVSRAGREYAWAIFEVSFPPLQTFLEQLFRLYVQDARTLKRWILAEGYDVVQHVAPSYVETLRRQYAPVETETIGGAPV
jgi:hypothetical protein